VAAEGHRVLHRLVGVVSVVGSVVDWRAKTETAKDAGERGVSDGYASDRGRRPDEGLQPPGTAREARGPDEPTTGATEHAWGAGSVEVGAVARVGWWLFGGWWRRCGGRIDRVNGGGGVPASRCPPCYRAAP
jgi:hypothetical protein